MAGLSVRVPEAVSISGVRSLSYTSASRSRRLPVLSVRRIPVAEPGSDVEGYDQNMWARAFNYSKAPFNELLSAYKFNRAWNLRLLQSLPARVRANGWINHSERGIEKGKHLLAMIAGHDLNHLSQIEAIKARFHWNQAAKSQHTASSGRIKRANKPSRPKRSAL